jgi:hypothetical protein
VLLISQYHDRIQVPLPDPLRHAGSWLAPLTLLAAAAAAYAIARGWRPGVRLIRPEMADPARRVLWVAVALFLLALILPPSFNLALAPAALLALFALALPPAAQRTRLSPALFAGLVGLLFVAVTAEPLWFMRRLGYAGSLASLIYVAVIALASAKPGSRLVWLMPAMALFHLPIAALLGVATTMAEVILALFSRKPTHLMGASVATAAAGLLGAVFAIDSAAFAPASARPDQAIALILAWPGLAPALLTVALTFIMAVLPLRDLSERNIGLSRAGLLTTAGLAASLFAVALRDQDASLLNAPGFAMFAKSGGYATPGLFAAGILALGLGLRRSTAPAEEKPEDASPGRALALVPAILLLVAVAKTDLKLRSGFAAGPVHLWRYVVTGELHPQWCRHLTGASLTDDSFYLSETDPTNDAIIYWSALKARLHIAAQRSDPHSMRILPALEAGDCAE